MTPEEEAILKDMYSFIEWSIQRQNSYYSVLGTLGHDVLGLLHHEECFLPRTSGYSEALKGE